MDRKTAWMPRLAFCNDIDFADWATYREVQRVLQEEFGIAAEDSFWLFAPGGSEMALFRDSLGTPGPRHGQLLEDIAAGKLTILHSAGNFSRTETSIRPNRKLVAQGLEYLARTAGLPQIWTNHGDEGDIQNIGWAGGDASYQQGDVPGSDCFILDLLLQGGLRYFWMDNHSTNEFVFRRGGSGLPLLHRVRTRAGYSILAFHRYRGALRKAPDAQTLGQQLTAANLEALVRQRGDTIIYQHWCVHRDGSGRPFCAGRPVFPPETLIALRRLAAWRDAGKVIICKVAELLREREAALPTAVRAG